jgi:hypothetical protein
MVKKALIILFALILVFPVKALAYIDPGTGSYMSQLIVAGIFGSLFALKVFWHKIKLLFKKTPSSEKNERK